jgi:hypothetical protein
VQLPAHSALDGWPVAESRAKVDRQSRNAWPESYLLDDDPSAMSDLAPQHPGRVVATYLALLLLVVTGAIAVSGVGSHVLAFLAR